MICVTETILASFLIPVAWSVAVNLAVSYAAYWIAAKIAGKSKLKMPEVNNYPLQTSAKGIPKQKIYGTPRTAGNVVWLGELHPYTVEHDSGGKGGGKGGATVEETRYKRSFLISLGHGPGSILRIWQGKKLIWPDNPDYINIKLLKRLDFQIQIPEIDVTLFAGVNNSGVRALTGEDYGNYKNDILAFFNEFDLGNIQSLPNFVFEVSQGPIEYYVGINARSGTKIVAKAKIDSTINTDWGDNGYWDCSPGVNPPTAMHALDDGRLLVAYFNAKVAMLLADGTLDTSWATNGIYTTDTSQARAILQDDSGNFHIIGAGPNTGSEYIYQKISLDGVFIAGITWNDSYVAAFNDACWSDDNKTRILAAGSYSAYNADRWNIMAIDATDGTIDTDWAGNISEPGFARMLQDEMTQNVYKILSISDGGFVLYFNDTDHMLAKMLADGSGLDTTWATNGILDIDFTSFPNQEAKNIVVDDNDDIYFLMNYVGTTTFYRIDSNGTIIDTHDETGGVNVYNTIVIFNNVLIITKGDLAQTWSNDFVYDTQFQVANTQYIYWLIPDTSHLPDANPAVIIRDFTASTRYGARMPADYFCDECFQAAENYWRSKGMLLSGKIDESKSWLDWVDYILAHVGGWRHFDGCKFHIGAFRDEAAVGDPLTDDDLVQPDPKDPVPKVNIIKRPYSDTYNQIEVVCTNRDADYDVGVPPPARDEVDQRISGQVRKKTVKLDWIHNLELGAYMAQRLLIDSMYRFDILKFRLGYKNMLIENCDVKLISDDHTGLASKKIRIMQKDESEHGRDIDITAIEEYSHLYPDIVYPSQANMRAADAAITLADGTIAFREDIDDYKMFLSIVPGNATANGWHIYQSYDDSTYQWIGRCGINGVTGGDANSSGTIDGYLPAHPTVTWSKDETILVSIGTVTDLASASEDEFWNDGKLARIGLEIIAYKTVEETATAGIWRITNLRRGLFGTEAVAHVSGEAFVTLDPDFTYKFSDSDIGRTVYFKALTFYGDSVQNIADLTGTAVTLAGYAVRPAAASLVRLTSDENEHGTRSGDYLQYSGASFTLYWNLGSRVSGFNYGDWLNLAWNNYIADADLQMVVLKFEQIDGTAIGEREIAVAESATITKATDLGGFDRARIRVVPRRALESRLENSILVESV